MGFTALKKESASLRSGYFDRHIVDRESAEGIESSIAYEVKLDSGVFSNGFCGDRDGEADVVSIKDRHVDRSFNSQKGVVTNPEEPNRRCITETVCVTEGVKGELGSRDATEVQRRREERDI